MNKVRIVAIIVVSMIVTTSTVYALEKKPISSISMDQLTEDTHLSASSGKGHINLVWWIPFEYWQVTLINLKTTPESDRKLILNTLRPYSLLMICQADISSGSFKFYSKNEIESKLDITFKSKNGSPIKLVPLKDIAPDLQIMLDTFKPILAAAAIENMGQNMHFFVLDDYDSTRKRKIDPYRFGTLNFRIGRRNGELMQTQLDFPLNSLYVPRKCPNGKEAHITWKYCPWTGVELED